MFLNGFIFLDRKFLTWRWYKDESVKSLFLHLLLTANFEDTEIEKITLKRGQVKTTIKDIAYELKSSEAKVRNDLLKIKMTGEITIKTTNKFSILTIVNYDTYQTKNNENNKQNSKQNNKQIDTLDSKQITNKSQTNNKQPIYNVLEEGEEGKKGKEVKETPPSFEDGYAAFIDYATEYFKNAGEAFDYNRLKLEAEEFAHYWFSRVGTKKTEWEKAKRSDLKATARKRFADRVGKIKSYSKPEQVDDGITCGCWNDLCGALKKYNPKCLPGKVYNYVKNQDQNGYYANWTWEQIWKAAKKLADYPEYQEKEEKKATIENPEWKKNREKVNELLGGF